MLAVFILMGMAYLIGSLSSAIIVCKFLNLADPRTEGSMNPGATNVLRIGGKVPALITLAGDMLKGFLPVLIAHLVGISGLGVGFIALAAFLGHLFPLFFKFQGGKGVATALGAFLALSPIAGIAIILCWLLIATVSRYVSLASMAAGASAPVFMLFFANNGSLLPVLAMSVLMIWRHSKNIKRLLAKTESKLDLNM